MQELRANTQVKVVIGPVVAVGDGFTPVTTLDLSTADEAEIMKHDAAAVTSISAATFAAITNADGYYNLTITTSLSDTEGLLTVIINDDSLCLPVKQTFMVLSEAAWDSKYVAKDDGFMDVNVKTIGRADTQETEATNLEAACAAYSATRGLSGTALPAAAADAAGGLPISDAGGLDLDAKLANTNEVTAARMGALTDWIDGGRLDLLLDGTKAKTDSLTFTVAGVVDANTLRVGGTVQTAANVGGLVTGINTTTGSTATIVEAMRGLVAPYDSAAIGSTGNDTTHLHLPGLTYGDDEINDTLLVIFDNSTGEFHYRWIEDWVLSTELATVATMPFTPQNATDRYTLTGIRRDTMKLGPLQTGVTIPTVTTVGTLTTYTGNTPQTGDGYAIVNSGTHGNAALKTIVDGIGTVTTSTLAIASSNGGKLDTIDGIVDAILVDTAEIGTAGAGLTNINLPNQTMDIVGNITGNLSGSVGSVTGAVGSVTGNVGGNVTGSVGSVTGNVGGNVTGSVGSLVGHTVQTGDSYPFHSRAVARCTVGSASSTTSIVTSACSPAGAVADQFKGRIVIFDAATSTAALRGQATDITASSNSSTPTLTVTALTTAPSSGDTFSIV